MNIASKLTLGLTLGLVSVIFVGAGMFATVNAEEDDEVKTLTERLNSLLAQLAALEGQSGSSSTASSASVSGTGNQGCLTSDGGVFQWTRNLSRGSTGNDVYQLQKFLNEESRLRNDPRSRVAVSGAGSAGNESTYYGPATATAVSGFQEMYEEHILTPLGLTKGTGGFYTSTRNHANKMCSGVTTTTTTGPTTPPRVYVAGSELVVSAGAKIADAYAVQGAQRVPYTSFVLTAGTTDVRVDGIVVKKFGLSSTDNFESVALVDVNGVQIGSARSLNSRGEAKLGSNLVIPKNRSVTLTVVGNIADEVDGGAVAGLMISEVSADVNVNGSGGGFPIQGAAHGFSTALDLQRVVVEVHGGGADIEFNEETEVAVVDIELTGDRSYSPLDENGDEEDAYLRSITLEQVGSANEREVGDVTVYVDGDRADAKVSVDSDRYVINFDGKGEKIDEGDTLEVTLETETDSGYGETVQFKLDDVSDVYVVGAEYGYGLPVCHKGDRNIGTTDDEKEQRCDGDENGTEKWMTIDYDNDGDYSDSRDLNNDNDTDDENEEDYLGVEMTDVSDILSGTVTDGGNIREFDDEVAYGKDRVLGAHSVEFEGEDINISDMTFEVMLSGFSYTDSDDNMWEDADEDYVSLENIRLRVDGRNVLYADDDVEFDEPSNDSSITESIDFTGSFTIDVRRDREVIFEIVADLDDTWSHFDGSSVEFTLTDVDEAEGEDSEKDYTDPGEYFAGDHSFDDVEIIGNEVEFEITDSGVDDTTYVAGSDEVIFATLEVDASGTIDDIELTDMEISFTVASSDTGSLSDIDDCKIMDGDDEVADMRGSLSGGTRSAANSSLVKDQARFNFDDYEIEKGDEVDLDIVCSINDDAESGNEYSVDAQTGDYIEYNIGRDDYEYEFTTGDDSDTIAISASGTIEVSHDNPDEDETVFAVATGSSGVDGIEVLEVEIEAEEEDARIKNVYLALGANLGAAGSSSVAVNRDNLEKTISSMKFSKNSSSTSARPRDVVGSKTFDADEFDNLTTDVATTDLLEFENVNETIEVDSEETFTFEIDFSGITDSKGSAGQFLGATHVYIDWEGEDSNTRNLTTIAITSGRFSTAVAFPTTLTVTTPDSPSSTLSDGVQKIYEFTVTADSEGDAYLAQIGIKIGLNNATIGDGTLKVYRGTNNSGSVRGTKTGSITAGNHKIEFDEVEDIDAGESQTYSVYADVTKTGSNTHSVTAELLHDGKDSSPSLGRTHTVVTDLNDRTFVWSPNTLDKDGSDTDDNDDWFTGWSVFSDSDTRQWSIESN